MKYCIGCRVSSEKAKREGKGLFVGGWCEDCVGKGEGVAAEVGDKRLLGMPMGFRVEVDEEVVKRDLERIERLNKRGSRAKVRYCGCGEVLGARRSLCDDCRVRRVVKERRCKRCNVVVGPRLSYCDDCREEKRRVVERVKNSVDERILSLPEEKVCVGCGELKDATGFYLTNKGYLTSRCRRCIYKINIASREKDKEKYLAYQREYHKKYDSNKSRGSERVDRFGLDKLFYNP